MLVSPRWHRGFDKGANSKPATQSWWYKPDSWYQACDQRDCFASLAMTPQMAVIARSGATKQSRCEARWRESSVWFRPLGRKWPGRHNLRRASGAPCYTLIEEAKCRDLNEEREKDGV